MDNQISCTVPNFLEIDPNKVALWNWPPQLKFDVLYFHVKACLNLINKRYNTFITYARTVKEISSHSGQVMSLESLLNDRYDPNRGIYIEDISNRTPIFTNTVGNDPDMYVNTIANAPDGPFTNTLSNYNYSGGFIVWVPEEVDDKNDAVQEVVSLFVLAGKDFIVKNYVP